MAEFSNLTENRSRWFWRFTLLAIILALVIVALLWRTLEIAAITDIQTRIEGLKPIFTGIRWVLIGLVAGFWSVITNGQYQLGPIDVSEKNQLQELRWRVLVWLVLLELVLGQNLISHFLQAHRGVEA